MFIAVRLLYGEQAVFLIVRCPALRWSFVWRVSAVKGADVGNECVGSGIQYE